MTERGHAKILDFGLAKVTLVLGNVGGVGATAASTVTLEDHLKGVRARLWGTIAYMSPEQVRAKELDSRTDLILIRCGGLRDGNGNIGVPWREFGSDFQSHSGWDATPAVRLNPDLLPKLEEIMNKCLEKDRNLRYQHASEIRIDLQRLKRDSESRKSAARTGENLSTGLHNAVIR